MTLRSEIACRHARSVLIGLICFECFLVAVFVADYLLGAPSYFVHEIFSLDGESCIPAWFSSMQFFATGVVLLLGGLIGDRSFFPISLMLGAVFLFLSADEAAMLHERLGLMLRRVEFMPRFKGNHGIWMTLYLVGAGVLAMLAGHRFVSLWRNFRRETFLLLCGFATLLSGAVGLEIVSYLFLRDGSVPLLYVLEVAAEEFCEMLGGSIMLYGASRFMMARLGIGSVLITVPGRMPIPSHAAADSACAASEMTVAVANAGDLRVQ